MTEVRPKQAETKKRKRKPWEIGEGWKAVNVGDGLLVGSAEGGFCGLEEYTSEQPWSINDLRDLEQQDQSTEDGKESHILRAGFEEKSAIKGKGKGKGKKSKLSEDHHGKESSLQKQLAAAEAENARLKKLLSTTFSKRQKAAAASADAPAAQDLQQETEAKVLNHNERKRLQRAQYKAQKRDQLKREKATARKGKKREERQTEAQDPAMQTQNLNQPIDGVTDNDANVDMSAWKPFELHPLIQGVLETLGFTMPTPIQQECLLPAIRDRRDVIGAAQTGSGKTLAFGLPMIQALLQEREMSPGDKSPQNDGAKSRLLGKLRGLVLTPTRELALQVSEHLQAVARPCGLRVSPIVGGIAVEKQERFLRGKPEVIVATPGRLWELMRGGAEHLTDLQDLSFLVLDEADRMVQQGHYEELSSILDYIPRGQSIGQSVEQSITEPSEKELELEAGGEGTAGGRRRRKHKLQTFVFSATLTLPESLRKRLRKGGGGSSGSVTLQSLMEKISFGHKPKIADLTSKRKLADKISEAYLECTEENREERLYYLLSQHPGRTLVFSNAISMVRRLAAVLKLLQLPVTALHSSMQQRQRLKALERFREDESAVLVATDVAARGLDIPEVACVVHYQLPAAADVYVHRCGRTGRASAEGISVALVTPKESARFAALQKAMGQDHLPLFPLDSALLPGARKRVQLAARLDEMLRSSTKQKAEKTWEQQMAEAAGIMLSDDEGSEEEAETRQPQAAKASKLQQELAELLKEPLQPKYSQRFFAGQPSAALAGKAAGISAGTTLDPSAVSQGIEHAQRLAEARSAGAAATAAKAKKQRRESSKEGKTQPPGSKQAAKGGRLDKRKALQGGNGPALGKSRFVVIPGALSRPVRGTRALDALRNKIQKQTV